MDRRFAAWLQAELDRLDLGVAEASRRIGVSQSMVSNWLNARSWPSRRSLRKVAAWASRPQADLDALLPDDRPTHADLHTPGAVRGILAGEEAAPAPGAQALLAEVALPLLLGEMTPEEEAYLADFARRVRARRAASAGGTRDDAGRRGPAGDGDAG